MCVEMKPTLGGKNTVLREMTSLPFSPILSSSLGLLHLTTELFWSALNAGRWLLRWGSPYVQVPSEDSPISLNSCLSSQFPFFSFVPFSFLYFMFCFFL